MAILPYGLAMPYSSALIVGAGAGLSAALSRAFAKEGMQVALAARSVDDLQDLARETGAKTFACDASKCDQVQKLFADLEASVGAPDVVVYNASYRTRGPFVDLDPADVEKSLAVSAFGGFLVAQEAARRMLPRGAGRDPVHRRFRQRQGLCAIGALRHGQVRVARAGAEPGARAVAAGHPCRACRDRRRHPQRRAAPSRRTSRIRCSIPTPSRRPICICCASRAAPGPPKSSCGRGWRNSDRR